MAGAHLYDVANVIGDSEFMTSGPADRIETVTLALQPFLAANKLCSIEEIDGPADSKLLAIVRPWGDRSIALVVPDDLHPFAEALNNLFLPARYSAVWHSDTKNFEILWTAFKLSKSTAEIVGRKFLFKFREKEYECEFTRSSDRVLVLGKASRALGQTDTSYRNLPPYDVLGNQRPAALLDSIGEPLSFWIRDLEWDEDHIFALVTHLNFYLSYFDAGSPVIVIHSPPYETATTKPTRYPAGRFPGRVAANECDSTLLYLWDAARGGEPAQRFLYYYRIIEYAATAYLDSSARAALRIALALPNALDDLSAVTESVVAAVQRMKMDEFARYETMLKELIEPKLLWREISLNIDVFTSDTQFDGGFTIAALFANGRNEAAYTSQDVVTFAKAIRDMRNALSHGRDQKTGTTITPTTHNSARLQPWIGPIRLAASQVILYRGFL